MVEEVKEVRYDPGKLDHVTQIEAYNLKASNNSYLVF